MMNIDWQKHNIPWSFIVALSRDHLVCSRTPCLDCPLCQNSGCIARGYEFAYKLSLPYAAKALCEMWVRERIEELILDEA